MTTSFHRTTIGAPRPACASRTLLLAAAAAWATQLMGQTMVITGTGWSDSSVAPGGTGTLASNTVAASALGYSLSGSSSLADNAYFQTGIPTQYNSATFGGDLWIAFSGGQTSGSGSANFKLSQGTDLDTGMVLRVGSINSSTTWDASGGGASNSNDPAASSLSLSSGDRLSYVVIHITFNANANDTANIWVFDSASAAPTTSAALAATATTFTTMTGDFAFDRLGLYAAANTTFTFDKITLSDSYLTPVPEPATYALLLGAGTMGVIVWRRRKHAAA